MREEKDLVADIQKAEQAKRIINDPMVKGALDRMRQTTFDNFRSSKWDNPEEREELYKMIRAIDAFEEEFKRQIDGGKKARSLLDKLLKKGE